VKARYSFRQQLNFRLIGYGAVMLALWFMLPSIPTLATFYYPDVVTDIDTDKEILYYLQQHNRAIVKTAQVDIYFDFLAADNNFHNYKSEIFRS
jgi:hypothetical protein